MASRRSAITLPEHAPARDDDGNVIGRHRYDERGHHFIELTDEECRRRESAIELEPEDFLNEVLPYALDETCDGLSGEELVEHVKRTYGPSRIAQGGHYPIYTENEARLAKFDRLDQERKTDETWADWQAKR
jgi:hypothetical protein